MQVSFYKCWEISAGTHGLTLSVYSRPSCCRSLQQDGCVHPGWEWQWAGADPGPSWAGAQFWGAEPVLLTSLNAWQGPHSRVAVLEQCTEQIPTAAHGRHWACQSSSAWLINPFQCCCHCPANVSMPITLKSRDHAEHWYSSKIPVMSL